MTPSTEQQLAQAYLGGDQAALPQLVAPCEAWLLQRARSLAPAWVAAEDLVHDLLLECLSVPTRLHGVAKGRCTFRAMMSSFLRRRSIDQSRVRRPVSFPEGDLNMLLDPASDQLDLAQEGEEIAVKRWASRRDLARGAGLSALLAATYTASEYLKVARILLLLFGPGKELAARLRSFRASCGLTSEEWRRVVHAPDVESCLTVEDLANLGDAAVLAGRTFTMREQASALMGMPRDSMSARLARARATLRRAARDAALLEDFPGESS